jgi:thymidylate synthase
MIKTFANKFRNANEAFQYWYQCIEHYGTEYAGTKALFNIGFEMEKPDEVDIIESWRSWKKDYASAEFQWYMSGKPYIQNLGEIYGKIPAIWKKMANPQGFVNSNYGYQWDRENQLDNVITMLRKDPDTRQAAISIFDGKERNIYSNDTPCTYAIQFTVVNNRLNMCVTMRSNDLWYGFCNDQYCFARLQQLVSEETDYELGSYYHFAHNLHLYEKDLGKFLPQKPDNLMQRIRHIWIKK